MFELYLISNRRDLSEIRTCSDFGRLLYSVIRCTVDKQNVNVQILDALKNVPFSNRLVIGICPNLDTCPNFGMRQNLNDHSWDTKLDCFIYKIFL